MEEEAEQIVEKKNKQHTIQKTTVTKKTKQRRTRHNKEHNTTNT